MCVQKFYFIILMNNSNNINYHLFDEINSILEDNIEIAEATHKSIKKQGEIINDIEDRVDNIEYISQKAKDIVNRMCSFFHRLTTKPIITNVEIKEPVIQMENIEIENTFVPEESSLGKLHRLKKIGIKIGEDLEEQNIKLDGMDINLDRNKSYLRKNVGKINKILN